MVTYFKIISLKHFFLEKCNYLNFCALSQNIKYYETKRVLFFINCKTDLSRLLWHRGDFFWHVKRLLIKLLCNSFMKRQFLQYFVNCKTNFILLIRRLLLKHVPFLEMSSMRNIYFQISYVNSVRIHVLFSK